MIQNTLYALELHLKRIDARTKQIMSDKQSLLICHHANTYIESLTYQASTLQEMTQNAPEDDMQNKGQLPAVTLTCQTLHGSGESLRETIRHLEERNSRNDKELLGLRKEGIATKQCLEVCEKANDTYREIVTVGVTSQVMVTTLADLFVVKNARSKVNPQLIGCYNSEKALLEAVRKHYETVVEGTSDDGV